jgi:flavorubredoxin
VNNEAHIKPDNRKNSITLKEFEDLRWEDHACVHQREREARDQSRALIDDRLKLLNELRADVVKDRTLYCTKEYAEMVKDNADKNVDIIRDLSIKNTEVIRETARDALTKAEENSKDVNGIKSQLNALLLMAVAAGLSGVGALVMELVKR